MNDNYLNYNKLKLFFNKLKTLFATKEDIKELKGEDGISITSVEQTTSSTADDGINTITVTLSDGTQSTFNVKNGSKGSTGAKGDTGNTGAQGPKGNTGATGTRGSIIYWGTAITGTSTTATIFSSSGVTSALVNDLYLNTSTWNIYQCTTAGAASTAKWTFKGNIKGATGAAGANATTTAVATTSANGLMSKEMVQKLGAIDGITSDINSESTTIAASSKMVHDLNSNLSNRIVTLYNNTDPFTNCFTARESSSSPANIIQLSDIPSNYKKLEITYGLITTNSTGNKWSPIVNTMIYQDCKTENLYNRFVAAVNVGEDAVVQININRNTKNMEVVVFSTHETSVIGFFIKTVKGIRF